jgi:hypothetical protein
VGEEAANRILWQEEGNIVGRRRYGVMKEYASDVKIGYNNDEVVYRCG